MEADIAARRLNLVTLTTLERTHKVLTLPYAIGMLRARNPWLARPTARLASLLPAALHECRVKVPIGGMLAIAAPVG